MDDEVRGTSSPSGEGERVLPPGVVTLRQYLGLEGGPDVPAAAGELTRGLLDASHLMIVVLDPTGRVAYVNGYFERLTGWRLAALEGRSWVEDCLPEAFRSRVAARFAEAIGGDLTVGNINPVRCADGTERIVEWFDRQLHDERGEVIGLLAMGHDLTARVGARRRAARPGVEAGSLAEANEVELRDVAEALQHSRGVLEGVFQSAPMLIAYLDREFNFVRVNDAYAAIDERTAEFFPGRNHFDLYPNDDNRRIFERVRDTGERHVARAKSFVYEHARERGVSHWDWILTPVEGPTGRVEGLVLALIDVTERVDALALAQTQEQRAQDSERYLREVIDTTPALITVCDPDGTVAEVNRAALDFLGTTREEVVGAPVWEVRPGLGKSEPGALVKELVSGAARGQTSYSDIEVPDGEGQPTTFACSFVPLFDTDGAVGAIVATAIDVTARREALAALRIHHQALEAALSANCIADLGGSVEYINPAFRRAWGIPDDEVVEGTRVEAFWEDPAGAGAAFAEVMAHGQHHGRLIAKTRGLGPRTMQIASSVVRDAAGAPVRVFASFIDVTEMEAATEDIRRRLAEKELLLKEIHHRVKNNLQIVSSLLQLQANQTTETRLHDLLEESQGRIRAMALVHDMLHLSSEEAQVSFRPYAERLVGTLRGVYIPANRQIDVRVSVECPPLRLDTAIPCGLIVNELVSNALKHGFTGRRRGVVSVELVEQGGVCHLSVSDDGVGMEPERGGEGLGLMLIRTLAQQLDGQTGVDSGSDGTRFTLTFALARDA